MPARRHSTSQASNSESLAANSSPDAAAAGAPWRSIIKPPECVSTPGRICAQRVVSIQTRPFLTGSVVADGSLTNFGARGDRKSTRLNSSHVEISYAVFCLKKKKKKKKV